MNKLFLFLVPVLILTSFNIKVSKNENDDLTKRNFEEFHYVYHFYKHELEESHIKPDAYKPKVFNINGRIRAQLYKGDTLIRFVHRSKSESNQPDSTVELFRSLSFGDKEFAMIPSELFGCRLLGVYYSSNEDIPENFYNCFYTNNNGELLKVIHLYNLGNVSAAFFFSKDSIDPTIKYKSDVARLLVAKQLLNLTDSVNLKFQ